IYIDKRYRVKGQYALTRMDTMEALGFATERYQITQNQTSADFIQLLTGDDEMMFDAAGSLDNGRRIFFVAKLPEDLTIAGDKVGTYFIAVNNHDGMGSYR